MAEAIISATEISLSYGADPLIDSASLAIHADDKAGLLGRNGCGKSSFLRILAGTEHADSGKTVSYTHLTLPTTPYV